MTTTPAPSDLQATPLREAGACVPSQGRLSCACGTGPGPARRRWLAWAGAGLAGGALSMAADPAAAQRRATDWPECKRSAFAGIVGADPIEEAAARQYAQLLREARSQGALAGPAHPQRQRLLAIAGRLVRGAPACNPQSTRWNWEVNLIGSRQINAFCMPGGKIAFYSGILDVLQLSDDEAAMVMGHEMAHALLDHARERVGKTAATRGLFEVGAALFGLGDVGRLAGDVGTQLLALRFSRSDESEADALGVLLGAEAGYDPRASITLWQKMAAANRGAPPPWLSTHPSSGTRIRDLQARMPRASQVYASARRDTRGG